MATVPQQAPPRKTWRQGLRLVCVILLLGLLAAFAIGNSIAVVVWPFRQSIPLFAVVLGCFALGVLVGWIGRGIAASRRRRAPEPPGPQASQS